MPMSELQISLNEFPQQLRTLRTERSISQRELAEKAKVSQQAISLIESGKMDPSLKLLTTIAVVLGVVLLIGVITKEGGK